MTVRTIHTLAPAIAAAAACYGTGAMAQVPAAVALQEKQLSQPSRAKAQIYQCKGLSHVRFTPKSGHWK